MAIKLGSNPKTFKKTLQLVDVNGKKENLQIEFKYRTRQQFAALMDERNTAEKAREEAEQLAVTEAGGNVPEKTWEQAVVEGLEIGTSRVLEIAQGWDLDDEFNKENLVELENLFPNALADIQDAYQGAILEARRKN